MKLISKENNPIYQYQCNIDKSLWTLAAVPTPKWGHDTSNIVESLKSSRKDIRHLPPLHLIDAIYSATMRIVFHRSNEVQKSPAITNVPLDNFDGRLFTAATFRVWESKNGIY
jgi:hypothetical protein